MKTWKNKTAFIYTRVSTTDQKDFGHSLDIQEELLRDFCEKNKITILKHFEDDHSAKNFDRPAFKKLLIFSKKNKVDLVLCYDWSRFSRDMYLSFSVISEFKNRGIEINTISQRIDYEDSSHLTMLAIYTSQPHVDNLIRSKNTKKGNNGALRDGRFINRAPIGYYNDKGLNKTKQSIIQIDPLKSVLVKEIFDKYATGIYTQESLRKEYYKQGIKIERSQFSNILSNIVYTGKVYVPEFENLPSEIVDGLHEPIIDEITFHKVQQIKADKSNIRLNSKGSKHEEQLPLRGGILKCVECERNLTGSRSKSRNGEYHYYYHCNLKKGCKERFKRELAHNALNEVLASLKPSKKVLELFKAILIDNYKTSQSQQINNIKKLKSNKQKLEDNLDNLTETFALNDIDKNSYNRLKDKYNKQINDIVISISEFSDFNKDLDKHVDFGTQLLLNIDVFYKRAKAKIKKQIIGSIFSEKLVFENEKYRTTKLNDAVALIFNNNNVLQNLENKKTTRKQVVLDLVAGTGLEPVTFGL